MPQYTTSDTLTQTKYMNNLKNFESNDVGQTGCPIREDLGGGAATPGGGLELRGWRRAGGGTMGEERAAAAMPAIIRKEEEVANRKTHQKGRFQSEDFVDNDAAPNQGRSEGSWPRSRRAKRRLPARKTL